MKTNDGQRAVDYMRDHMAMVDWEVDQWQNWIAGHMANFAKFERARIRRAIAPHLKALDSIDLEHEPTCQDSPTCASCGEFVGVRPGCDWDDGDICDACTSEVFHALRPILIEAIKAIDAATKAPRKVKER